MTDTDNAEVLPSSDQPHSTLRVAHAADIVKKKNETVTYKWPNASPSANATPTTPPPTAGASSKHPAASSSTTTSRNPPLSPNAVIAESVSQIVALRPRKYATISKRKKTVQRAYGGSRCGDCVKSRILRAFLVEEAKIVKKVIKQQKAATRK
ncbi:hypothetical protein AX14_004731 [Amanita brunnescens Koide BX004]|nr:hypothetical protein AX14_004731 [Amanita brunnescens Koide BX004]